MAKEDYTVADRDLSYNDSALTAGDKVAQTVYENPDADAAEFAETNGVSQAAYANYATALNAHQAREDIETLADRRAREYGDEFADADFMRAEVSDTAPTPGSTNGVAPASA